MTTLSAAALHALADAAKAAADEARDSLTTGDHDLDETVTLHIGGTVSVSDGESYIPTVSIPLKEALALTLQFAGITREAAIDALTRAMTEALRIKALKGKDAKVAKAQIEAQMSMVEDAEALVREGLDSLPPQTRKGKVRCAKAAVEEVATEKKQAAA